MIQRKYGPALVGQVEGDGLVYAEREGSMTAFKMSKYAPYRSVAEYLQLRPSYFFEGRSAESWVAEAIGRCFPDAAGGRLAECGAGPGPLWDLLPRTLEIMAIEPNRSLWTPDCPPQVTYCEQDGFQFLVDYPHRLDVIAWMWALNYPLLAFFEEYEPQTRTVTRKDWLDGHHHCLDRLVQILKVRCKAKWVVLFFDDASVEQKFVTRIWQEDAPFPFQDRAHTRRILEMAFNYQASELGGRVEKVHLQGLAEYGPLDVAVQKMMNFHLRGNFADQERVRKQATAFLSQFEASGEVRCPAGAYLYRLLPEG